MARQHAIAFDAYSNTLEGAANALNRSVRTLMGDSYWRLDERIALLCRSADECAEEVARANDRTAETCADTVQLPVRSRDGYAGTFSEWLAEQEKLEESNGAAAWFP